jgi:hypothetical protein
MAKEMGRCPNIPSAADTHNCQGILVKGDLGGYSGGWGDQLGREAAAATVLNPQIITRENGCYRF